MAYGGSIHSSGISVCSICRQKFRERSLLPCSHIFCSHCLSDHIQGTKRGNIFDCPLCRKSITIPQNGVAAFQANFYMQSERGTDSHPKQKARKKCEKHSDEELRLICKTCDQCICLICDKKFHKYHSSELISEEADQVRKTLKEDIDISGEKHLATLEEICKHIKRMKSDIPKLQKSIDDKISNRKQKLISSIQKVAEQAETKVEDEFAHYDEKLNDELECCQANLASFDSLLGAARLILEKDDDYAILRKGTSLSKQMKEQILIQEKQNQTTFSSNVDFAEGNVKDKDLSKLFGTVMVHRNKTPSLRTTEVPRFTQSLTNVALTLSNQYHIRGYGVNGISCVGDDQAWLVSHTACLYNKTGAMLQESPIRGNHLASDESGYCFLSDTQSIVRISSRGDPTTFCQMQQDYCHGLIFCKNNNGDSLILVCVSDSPFLRKDSKGSVLQLKLPDGNKSTFCKGLIAPVRLAARAQMEVVAVSDYAANRVTIHNSSGEVCAQYSGEGLGDGIKFEPYGLCFDHGGCIIAANRRAGNVLRISTSGQLLQVVLNEKNDVASIAISTSRQLWVGYQNKSNSGYLENGKVEIYDIA